MSQSVSVTAPITFFSRADVHAAKADEGLTEHSVDGHAKKTIDIFDAFAYNVLTGNSHTAYKVCRPLSRCTMLWTSKVKDNIVTLRCMRISPHTLTIHLSRDFLCFFKH